MTLRRITGPGLPITVDEAKANGRIDTTAEDALVENCIRSALAHAEKWAGAAFQSQIWELVLDEFPSSEIEIPYGPVLSITSVKYIDGDGAEQTTTDYEIDLTPSDKAWVIPTEDWPTTMDTANAVTVRFVAGDAPPDDVRQAILLLTEHFYDNRAASSGEDVKAIPFGVFDLLNLHRRLFV